MGEEEYVVRAATRTLPGSAARDERVAVRSARSTSAAPSTLPSPIYRRHFVAIVVAMAVAVVPLELLTLAPRPWGADRQSLLQVVMLGGVTPGVATLVVADVRAGVEPTAATVWRRLAPDARGARAVGHARARGGAGASIVLLVVPFLLLIVWFQFVGQVVVVERRRFFAAMGRSRDLVQGSYWRVAGYAILGVLITGLVSGALAAAPARGGGPVRPAPGGHDRDRRRARHRRRACSWPRCRRS